jgi:leader peptidase (prepilin peptidase)/N-methyltransferase
MAIAVWLVLVFLIGAAIGSFVNVCIARLPLEKSALWPLESRCGHCLQPIRWYDNVPLLSYWILRGRCRKCGARFSVRYFVIELLTGLGFAGIFYLEIILNVHHFAVLNLNHGLIVQWGMVPWQAWVVFGVHALLFTFLLVAAGCDLEHRDIPLGVTLVGTVVGLIASTIWSWPWPYPPAAAAVRPPPVLPQNPLIELAPRPWWIPPVGSWAPIKEGLCPWPVWWPLPEWLQPGGAWQMGLISGLAGLVIGSCLVRVVRFLFSRGLGVEALGLGDADMMMMAGSFLGWQLAVTAFFIAVFPGLIFGVAQIMFRRDNSLPFGPALAIGVLITWLGWHWIGPRTQPLFFNPNVMLAGAVVCGVFLLGSGYILGWRRARKAQA